MSGLAAEAFDSHTVNLIFKNLYDDVWAVLEKPRYTWQRPKIIMPQGFQPEIGKSYECEISSTMFGTFIYNAITYDLCYATWVEAANVIEVINHRLAISQNQGPKNNALAEALKGIDRAKLAQVEMVTLEVQTNPKKGGLMFKPQYLEEDPHADNLPTMRFFWPTNQVDLQLGKIYHARIKRVRQTNKETQRKALIIHVDVEVVI